MKRGTPVVVLGLVHFGAVLLPAETHGPVAVSPGDPGGFTSIAGQCPTFSWGFSEKADSFDIIVYRVTGDRSGGSQPIVATNVPGSADSWTPSLDRCLEAGERYAWSVGAVSRTSVTRWSLPSLFQVTARPNEDELRSALAIVRAYVRKPADQVVNPGQTPAPTREPRAQGRPPFSDPPAVPEFIATPDKVGVQSEVADGTGITFGVHGLSYSEDDNSAGVVGESTAGVGNTIGVAGQVASAFGAAGVFNNVAGGDILRGLNDGVELFSLDSAGIVTAAGFDGDGSGLTSVTAVSLAADGTNRTTGEFAAGVDGAGNAQGCAPDAGIRGYETDVDISASQTLAPGEFFVLQVFCSSTTKKVLGGGCSVPTASPFAIATNTPDLGPTNGWTCVMTNLSGGTESEQLIASVICADSD